MIIGVTGYPCSGKAEISRQLKKRGFKILHMHSVVIREVKKRGLKINEENMGKVSLDIRDNYSRGYIASEMVTEIHQHKKVCIDGIRDPHEINIFRDAFGKRFIAIAVIANEKLRYQRALSRKRKDDATDWKRFEEKDKRERSWGLDEAIEIADYKIINENGFKEFREKVKKILDRLCKKNLNN